MQIIEIKGKNRYNNLDHKCDRSYVTHFKTLKEQERRENIKVREDMTATRLCWAIPRID